MSDASVDQDLVPAAPLDGAAPEARLTDDALPLAASLRQWHNRLPWARRLAETEVSGVGLVKLALSDDAAARPLYPPQTLVPGVSASRLARFLRRHGYDERPGPPDWPVRELGLDPVQPDQAVRWRYLLTATYPAARGDAVLRVLAGRVSGARAMPFAGRRAVSARRLAISLGLGALLLALIGGAVWAWRGQGASPSVAPAVPAASAPASAALVALAASPAPTASQGTAEAAAAVQASSAGPASAVTAAGKPEPALAAPVPEPASTPASAPGPHAASAPAGPLENLMAPGTAPMAATPQLPLRYALVSAPQTDADGAAARSLRQVVSQSLSLRAQDRRLEWMPSPEGQVLTLWPFEDKAEAERLARKLQRQGLKLQVVAF